MAKEFKPKSTAKARQIADEIVDKVGDYETNMSGFMSKVGEWGDLFQVRLPERKKKTFSNPRLTEFFRAVNTLGTMMYRMQTAQDPFFDLVPMSLLRYEGQLMRIQAALETQLEESQYKRNLLKADMGMCAFGTQIVEEHLETIGINPFGRRVPVTTFKPRSLLQVAFERGTTDIQTADWIATMDLISDSGILSLDDDNTQEWESRMIEEAAKDKSPSAELNQFILNRLTRARFIGVGDNGVALRKEILRFNGKLDTMNDNVEYCAVLINRKYLVQFYPNRNQHGKRDFRIAHWVEDPLTLDPLSLGVGAIAGNLHKSMDANRQRATDAIAFASYNMFERLRDAGINDDELKIRPMQIIDMDMHGGIKPILTDLRGADASLKLEDVLRNEFMAASGATPTLQAQLTDATASEVSLAQNEAVRNISVKAELSADPFVREHLRIMHSNNVQFVKQPIRVNKAGFAGMVYPKDLQCDVDFKIKITTDKDYKPQRLTQIKEVIAILTSTKSMHPDMANIRIAPLVRELIRGLGVNPSEVISEGPPDPAMLQAMGAARGGAGQTQGMEGAPGVPMTPAEDVISTPVGPVMGSSNI